MDRHTVRGRDTVRRVDTPLQHRSCFVVNESHRSGACDWRDMFVVIWCCACGWCRAFTPSYCGFDSDDRWPFLSVAFCRRTVHFGHFWIAPELLRSGSHFIASDCLLFLPRLRERLSMASQVCIVLLGLVEELSNFGGFVQKYSTSLSLHVHAIGLVWIWFLKKKWKALDPRTLVYQDLTGDIRHFVITVCCAALRAGAILKQQPKLASASASSSIFFWHGTWPATL